MMPRRSWRGLDGTPRTHQEHTKNTARKPQKYPLAGLVRCGCCGQKMTGARKTRKKNGKTYEYSRYICSTYLKFGNRDKFSAGCNHCRIDADKVLSIVTHKLRNGLLRPENIKRIEAEIRSRVSDGDRKRLK